MNGHTARDLRKLVKTQFEGFVNPKVIRQTYRKTKKAWKKTPCNQRAQFKQWLGGALNLLKTVKTNTNTK